MSEGDIEIYCDLDEDSKQIMAAAYELNNITVRGYHRILRVARTIADLEESDKINSRHISEAICYRSVDKRYWGDI